VVQPNFRNSDIRQVIEAVGAVTGRNFLVDPSVNAEVTLIANSPMSPEAFYQAFLSTLEVHGFAAVDAGDVTKIVPEAGVLQMPGAEPNGAGEELVTRLVALQHVDAAQLVPILRPMMPQYAHLAAHMPSNTLILADRAANVAEILRIVRSIDQLVETDIEIIPLENGSAGEVAQIVGSMAQAVEADGGPPGIQVAVDARTNSLLLSGQSQARLRYRALIAALDAPAASANGTRVRYLKFARAEDLVAKLQGQFTTTAGEAPVAIWAHPGTNSLVLTAAPRTLEEMLRVIDRLDIRRAQVHVDAIIAGVTEELAAKLGVTWAFESSDEGAGLTNFGSTVAGLAQVAGGSGNGSGPSLIPEGIAFGIGRIRDSGLSWAALLTALRGDGATTIISTPSILTLDNEEAEITVGQEVPLLTGQFANSGAGQGQVNPFQTIQRQEVGTRLAITPRINEGTGVRLRIEQENSAISASSAGAVDLITNDRSISTTVFVDDGGILVLGGMIEDQLRESEQRVPGLGSVPGFGWLFRARDTQRSRTQVMVFIRPRIIRNEHQAVFETEGKYTYLRDLQMQQAERPVALIPDEPRPLLPPFSSSGKHQPAN
jgi:general secretion pathway protein D